jgi:hypothetical protein
MPQLTKAAVSWSGLLPAFVKLVAAWQPTEMKSELAYRNALYSFLKEAIPPDCRIEKEYRHRGTTVDIWLSWKGLLLMQDVAIELKVNLRKKSEYDRLVGQIEQLEPRKQKVVVVLVGETADVFLYRLRERYADLTTPPIGTEPSMAVATVQVVGVGKVVPNGAGGGQQ